MCAKWRAVSSERLVVEKWRTSGVLQAPASTRPDNRDVIEGASIAKFIATYSAPLSSCTVGWGVRLGLSSSFYGLTSPSLLRSPLRIFAYLGDNRRPGERECLMVAGVSVTSFSSDRVGKAPFSPWQLVEGSCANSMVSLFSPYF